MTYEASEQSKHDGRPVELFKYEGTYANFYYTSGPLLVNFEGNDYVPLRAMRRSAINNATQNDDNAEVTVEMPVSTDIIAIYGFQISPPELTLTIYRGHNPGEYVRYWSGNVENIQVVKGTATIRVPSQLAAALSADFPNVYFQTPCNHDLYDARCGVVYDDWSIAATITAIAANAITIDDVGILDGQLVGGEAVLASGERRMITAQAGNVITVNYPFAGASVTDAVIIAAGCDLAYQGDCKVKFDNTKRFGGFPYIPPKNIFASGLEPGKDVADVSCIPYIPYFEGWYVEYLVSWSAGVVDNSPGCYVESETSGETVFTGGGTIRPTPKSYLIRHTNPASYAPQVRDLRLQFDSGSVPGGQTATFAARRWDSGSFSSPLPMAGSQSMGNPFSIRGLWPDNWFFTF